MSDRRPSVPQEGSIQKGKVIRVEPAYCILQLLDSYPIRGLLHVSEMDLKGSKMDEVMSLDDVLYCRILSVSTEEGPQGRPRQKVKLSTRSLDTQTGQESTSSTGGNAVQQQLSQSLNSTIGMGVALDPMASSNLILKSDRNNKSGGGTLINGYALVDDTEGEPDLPPPPPPPPPAPPMGRGRGTTMPAWMTKGSDRVVGGETATAPPPPTVRPMGRGRGTTLPAWMTRGADTNDDDKKKQQQEESASEREDDKRHRRKKKKRKRRSRRDEGSNDESDKRHRHKKHRRREERRHRGGSDNDSDRRRRRKKHRRQELESLSDASESDRRHDHKKHRRREERHFSRSFDSNRDDDGSVRSGSSDSRRRRKPHRKSRRHHHSDSSADASRNERRHGEMDKDDSHRSSDNEGEFSTVAEAKRLIAELEEKRRCERQS